MTYPTLADSIGNTPIAQLRRLPGIGSNTLLVKLEGNNPAGSVKDRPAYSMIRRAEERGEIKPGDVLIEATSGNTGIALAMAAAVKGYKMVLIMPEHLSVERRASMKAYGAELILVTKEQGMEGARDLALQMQADGKGKVLDQFANPDNPRAHYEATAPEIWQATQGRMTHFVSSMGTTGTIMGCSRYFKEQSETVQVIGVQPDGESSIPGIRKWPQAYLPAIFDAQRIDRVVEVTAKNAEDCMREAGRIEGLFCGPSGGGALWVALQICKQTENATIVTILPDRGDRYISTGVFPS
ncbi:MAG TPA: cysteine synthase CysM [Fontimonas sp.]